jgi:Flp pilus assembly protein TadG
MTMYRWMKQRRRNGRRGQTLVEFALVFPIFILLFIGLIEFAVTFSIILNVNYASRDAALLAAEVGDTSGGDCLILQALDNAINGATHHQGIQEVRIFWADANGAEQAANVYSEGGTTTCNFTDGTTLSVPFTAGALNYPESSRCPVLSGCGGAHPTLDTIGVSITFHHDWLTPLPNLVQVQPTGVTFTRSNSMRMEPVL